MTLNIKEDGRLLEGDAVCGYIVAMRLERAGVCLIAELGVDGDLEPLLAIGGLGDVDVVPTSKHYVGEE